jgi:hypothetical protein
MADSADEPEVPDPEAEPNDPALQARRDRRAALPATYVDTWATLIWKGHIRVVLGEWIAREPYYRAAYLMELDDAEKFANALLERVARQRERDAARAKKDQSQESET